MVDRARIAVTGAGGRLGTALMTARPDAISWGRPDHDLDEPSSAARLLDRDEPDLVIHTAAWTDVDGCAREPDVALRRNGEATGALARACAERGVGLLVVSTNEVFDGDRTDCQGYLEDDPTGPRNPYGASKLAGELAAREAFGDGPGLWIARTAWLYGPPGNDFPTKIVAAADRLPEGEALPVVSDEVGSPTFAVDLAAAILALIAATDGGIYHLVNNGAVSRLKVAEHVLGRLRPERAVRPISRTEFTRASDPPPWAVLDNGRAAAAGVTIRGWTDALDTYVDGLAAGA
jgi:dTDP-4-dehydrorhamnose reductase